MEHGWLPNRSPELREQARREIARMREQRRQVNGACSRQRARQLDEDGQAGVQPDPLKARDSKRQ
jgi:hypothetical protein